METKLFKRLKFEGFTVPVKVIILLAVFSLDILLGMLAEVKGLLLAVGAVGGLVGLVILLRRPEWGILFIIPASFIGKWNIGTGTNVAFNFTIVLIILLLGIWLLRMLIFERNVTLVRSSVTVPALTFIGLLTLSFVVGNIQWIPKASAKASIFGQLGGWLLYFLSICALILPGNLLKDLRLLKIVVWEFLILGFIFIYASIIPFTGGFATRVFVNGGFFGSTFWIWITAFATSYLLFSKNGPQKQTIFFLLLLGAVFYRGWFLYREWISGWGPPLIAVAVILWLRNWRAALIFFILAGIVAGLMFSSLSASVMTDTQQYSAYSRSATWPIMFEIVKANPIFGLGPSNYYYYTPLFSLLGWNVSFNSHNNYIDIVAQYGFLGLIVFGWLIYTIARMGWQLKDRGQDEFSRVYVHACLGGLVGMLASGLLGDWFLPFLYNISTGGFRFSVVNWLFLGGLVVIDLAHSRQASQ